MYISEIKGNQSRETASSINPVGSPKDTASERRPEKAEKNPEAKTTINTDEVDREIKQLKERKRQIEQQIQSEQDEQRKHALEQELKTIESMLSFKDNDAYRRQNAIVV